ncbi:MAG: phospho-N-acetylmuramoyl-pentapeptide-transferase [Peptococcaceae bacterium]|nr:phospho-N-acetylmuramoyl-pentapeptide-transferase [Peptococcaceae bacterium]
MKIALATLITAFIIAAALGPILIPIFRWMKFRQTIRSDGPQRHLAKAGTPTMGGIIFLLAFVVSAVFWGSGSKELYMILGFTLAFGFIGFLDDFIKVALKRSLGLTAKEKLVLQFVVAAVLCWLMVKVVGRGTEIIFPGIASPIDFGWFYYLFMAIYIVGMVNATNLTDGLDGLAAGISFIVFLGYMLIGLLAIGREPIVGVNYLDVAIAAAALAGGCLGFLLYNHYPAKVFMGDTGSLALGGGLMVIAMMTKTEVVLLFMGAVYLMEALSVILQVFSFKCFGKRIFRMSPLHHHFEMLGWSELKVVYSFWLAAAFSVCIGLWLTTL